MKKSIITIFATLAVIAATLCIGFTMSACTDKKADSYTFTVVYPDNKAVNGHTDGTAGPSDKEVQIQICAAIPDTDTTGFCTLPVTIGEDGKVEIKQSHFSGNTLESGYKWHVQVNGVPAGYTYDKNIYLDGYGEYTIKLVAQN